MGMRSRRSGTPRTWRAIRRSLSTPGSAFTRPLWGLARTNVGPARRAGGRPAPVYGSPGTRARVDPAGRGSAGRPSGLFDPWSARGAPRLDVRPRWRPRWSPAARPPGHDIGTRLGVPATRVLGRNAEARILIFQGHLQEGLAVLDETAVAALSGELDPVSTALLYCSTVCAFQGLSEYDKAEEWTTAMERWCRRHATGGFHGLCRVHRAEILRLRGDWVDAEVEAREASEELRRYSRTDVGWASAELGQIRLRMGNLTVPRRPSSMPTSRGGTRIPVWPSFGSREELSRRPRRRSETRWSVSPRSPRSRPLPTPTSGVRPCWRHRSGSPSPQATWGTLARPPGTST
jgi:hypothetical protein